MSGSEAVKWLNLWPKLLLLGAVILVAFLYLRSVDRSGTGAQQPEIIERAAEPSETSEADVALPMQTRVEADLSVTGGGTPQGADAEGTRKMDSTDQADAGVIVNSDQPSLQAPESETDPAVEGTRFEPESPEAAAAFAAERPVAEVPLAAEGDGAGKASSEEPMAASDSVSLEGGVEQDSLAAKLDAVPALPAALQATATASGPGLHPPDAVPAGSAPPVQGPMTFPTESPARETVEAQRARVMSEYEAMRKRAEEEMRRRWDRGRMPGPYGYPQQVPGNYPPPR